jgi:hypothetical protein
MRDFGYVEYSGPSRGVPEMTSQVLTSRPQRHLPLIMIRWLSGRSVRKAAATAEQLDRIVDRDLELVASLPVPQRARPVEKLAALVMLAQAYRHYAAGWITRRELRRRSRAIFDELTTLIVSEATALS